MSDLEPITRAENFWVNEGDLEPITRKEQYIKHLYDETQVVPEYPKTREEYFINKAGEELHDVTVEQLNVTENGTYSEAGKAYSPVIVEVPEPTLITKSITQNGTYTASSDNADGYSSVDVHVSGYKISEVSGLPSAIAIFSDGANLPMPKLEVAVNPIQDLHGYDSPWVGGSGKNKYGGTFTLSGLSNNDGTFTNTITDSRTYFSFAVQTYNGNTLVSNTSKPIGETGRTSLTFDVTSEVTKLRIKHSGSARDLYVDIPFTLTGQFTISLDVVGCNPSVVGGLVFKDVQVESGNTATTFAPYSNICPISGWDEVDVTVADDVDNPTVTQTTTIPFLDSQGNPVEVYGGSCDVVNGTSGNENTWKYYNISDITFSESGNYYRILDNSIPFVKSQLSEDGILSHFNYGAYGQCIVGTTPNSGHYIMFYKNKVDDLLSISSVEEFNAYLQAQKTNGTPVQLAYKLAEPSTFYTQPTAIKSLQGLNNVFADTGDVLEASYWESL